MLLALIKMCHPFVLIHIKDAKMSSLFRLPYLINGSQKLYSFVQSYSFAAKDENVPGFQTTCSSNRL